MFLFQIFWFSLVNLVLFEAKFFNNILKRNIHAVKDGAFSFVLNLASGDKSRDIHQVTIFSTKTDFVIGKLDHIFCT